MLEVLGDTFNQIHLVLIFAEGAGNNAKANQQ